ncbi:protein amalgam-like [Trichogramma pretiosum]|uniref:protein amalgam-like n=1 Tax=Trichogramma pretiosum TaxID=7493 RepID=UPI0006C966FA|nr:protein amalgam-like [Trichogramma pretiosum]
MSTGTMYLSSWKWSTSASSCKDNNRASLVLAWQLFLVLVVSWTSAHNDPATDLPRFGKPLNNLTVSVGREAVFACIVENLGPYKVAWLRVDTQTILTISNHVITKNHRIAVTHSGHRAWSLHIRDTREADRGWYMCQVNTDPMSSITGFLEVVVPPDILDYPTSTDMIVSENSNVTLRCAATGTPEPTVTWRREAGGTITTSNGQEVPSIEGPELEITRVNRLHMGAYLCIASNGIPPSVSKRIVLIVHFPPMIRVENQLFGAYEGQTLVLECHSEGYPRPIMYWTKPNNETVTNDGFYKVETSVSGYETLMKLSIRSVRPQDYGPFFCLAENSLGRTDGKIKVYQIQQSSAARNNKASTRRDSKKNWSERSSNQYEKVPDGSLSYSELNDDGEEEDGYSSSSNISDSCLLVISAICLAMMNLIRRLACPT